MALQIRPVATLLSRVSFLWGLCLFCAIHWTASAQSLTKVKKLQEFQQRPPEFTEIKRVFVEEGTRLAAVLEHSPIVFTFLNKGEFRERLLQLRNSFVLSLESELKHLVENNLLEHEEAQDIRRSLWSGPAPLNVAFQRLYREGPGGLTADAFAENAGSFGDLPDVQDVGGQEFQDFLDASLADSPYSQYRPHNRFELLVDGVQLRESLFQVIDSAESFLNISQFTITSDRIGSEVLKRIVANQMRISPDELQAVLERKGWVTGEGVPNIQKHVLDVMRWYLAEHLRRMTNDLADDEIGRIFHEMAKPLQVHFVLDGAVNFLSLKNSFSIVSAVQKFGAKVHFVGGGSLTYLTNHSKIISNEHQALIQGNSLLDKSYAWNPEYLEWHDAGVLIKGQLVNTVNHYFFDLYNSLPFDDIDYFKDPDFYFPPANETPPADYRQGGRLVTHIHMNHHNMGKYIFAMSVAAARRQILAENPFFADSWHANIMREKARQFQLEGQSTAQCEAATPGDDQGRIVVVLTKYTDQPLVKLASDGLINGLLSSGVSVCKWDGAIHNQKAKAQGLEIREYKAETMMHLKVWSIDDSLAYIGTANWLARSRAGILGDLEVGLLTNDPKFVGEIQDQILWKDIASSEPTTKSKWNTLMVPVHWIFSRLFKLL